MAGYLQVPQCSAAPTWADVIAAGFFLYDAGRYKRFIAMPEIGVPFENNTRENEHRFKVNYYQSGSLYNAVIATVPNTGTTRFPGLYRADDDSSTRSLFGNFSNTANWRSRLCYYSMGFGTDYQLPPGASLYSTLDECLTAMDDGQWDYVPDDTDPYANIDGEGGFGGGVVGIPNFPALTATSTGIVGLFAPSAAQMQQLADFMWTDFGGTATTIETVLSEIVEALKRLISNPLDYILGLNIIPSQGLSVGGSSVIKFGYVSSGVSMPRLSNQYFTVDCGAIFFDTVCGDTFLDYAPYSKFSIYLPYIGVRAVDANDFVGHTIGVVYHGDTVTGGVTAFITKDGSVMYQFSGSCALNIPLSSDNWGSTLSAAVNIATTIVEGAASGGAAGVAKAAALGAASVAANPSQLSPQVAHSGAVSGSAGAMGVQYPYVIREAVRFHPTTHFNTMTGYPAYYFRTLADVQGYTKVLDCHLTNIPATQDEIAEIESILKEGAIF